MAWIQVISFFFHFFLLGTIGYRLFLQNAGSTRVVFEEGQKLLELKGQFRDLLNLNATKVPDDAVATWQNLCFYFTPGQVAYWPCLASAPWCLSFTHAAYDLSIITKRQQMIKHQYATELS
jgi:hypothetical protein